MELEEAYTATEISELRYDAYIMGRKKEYEKSMKVINKQNKIIDLMAQWISDRCLYEDTDSNYCEITQDSCYEWKYGARDCKQCIKQYFEKKVEENK